ncbi:MAG TPA: DNA-processing protein DprA [Bacillota bacterium]|nr:DNA-processing protein DprA [Bacillota bacterium]HNU93200.1 DNA-processing protein DprA [Bacillota bacterium]HNY67219.1 DNA-processing protein DprA [Bacillota bacterium]HOI36609.1 DNA-processing protein DprA [Bacillota bacterium]HPU74809.1 DNA-processing protein DprA [Bacillota bacterium]
MDDAKSDITWDGVPEPRDAELASWVFWHMCPGIGPRSLRRLLMEFGTAAAAAHAASRSAKRPDFVSREAWRIASSVPDAVGAGQSEIELASRHGARVVALPSREYPPLLRQIYDPPAVLYVMGRASLADAPWIAVVGSRSATSYGTGAARYLARQLTAAGAGVVSGMARGVDSAAHRGAIEAGGVTVGVIGAGLAYQMTPRLQRLAGEVAKSGCVVSPFHMNYPASRGTFPARNRVISGMAHACLVVEAGVRSGALVTSAFATEQNRDVFAVPGDINRPTSAGTNALIYDGARPVIGARRFLEELAAAGIPVRLPNTAGGGRTHNLGPADEAVFEAVQSDTSFEDIHLSLSMPARDVLASLSRLEVLGLIVRGPGLRYSRKHC